MLRPPNTDGWGNKLVTTFARHLDSFIMTINFPLNCQICDFGSGQILPPRQLYFSPGFAKIAPWWLARRDYFRLKYRDPYRRTAPPAFTTATAGPLAQIVSGVIGLAPPSIGFVRTIIFRVIWTEISPHCCTLTTSSEKHISYIWRNLSAGQSWTIPAKLLVLTPQVSYF